MPVARIQPLVGRRCSVAADAEQRPEGVERIEAPVEPERKFVEIGLKMLRRDAVMAALKPTFEVAENQVDDREKFFRDCRIASLNNGQMLVAELVCVNRISMEATAGRRRPHTERTNDDTQHKARCQSKRTSRAPKSRRAIQQGNERVIS